MSLQGFKVRDLVDKNVLSNLDLPEDKRARLWKDCVEQAKVLIGNYKEIRIKVVELALQCCVIHHGGKPSSNRYTMKSFAREIGIAPATFFEWYRLRSIYLALPKKEQNEISFTQLSKLSREITGIDRKDKNFKDKLTAKYRVLKNKSETTVKMEKYLRVLKTINFNVSHDKMIKDCEQEVLTEMLHVARSVVSHLSKQDKKPKYANVG